MVEPVYFDFHNAFMQGRQAGRQIRQQKITDNALARYASGDTQGGIQDLMAADPEAAFRLQDRDRENEQYGLRKQIGGMVAGGDLAGAQKAAASGGDFDTWGQLGKFDQVQRDRARQISEDIAGSALMVMNNIPETDITRRTQAILAAKPQLVQHGVDPAEIDRIAQNPTDAALNAVIASGMQLKDMLDYYGDEEDREIRRNQIKILGDGANAITADGRVIASNPKNFAPKTGSGKGSGPAPWTMKW